MGRRISQAYGAIGYALEDVLFCASIVGIPFGLQLFKMSAKLALCPFDVTVR